MGDTEEWRPHILHLSALQLHDEAGRMSMEWLFGRRLKEAPSNLKGALFYISYLKYVSGHVDIYLST